MCSIFNWINGVTCSELFKSLTPFERNLLVMSYIEKKTDTEIAQMYGLCRATIFRKKQAAIEKILYVNSDI